jgi:hypothetical protein
MARRAVITSPHSASHLATLVGGALLLGLGFMFAHSLLHTIET